MAILARNSAHHRLCVAGGQTDHPALKEVPLVLSRADRFESALTLSAGQNNTLDFVAFTLSASSVGPPTAIVARLRVIGIVAPLECPNERVEFGLDPVAGEPVMAMPQ